MATGVSLPDEYVLLLQNVVKENRLLREQMASSIASNETALKSIDDKVNIMARTSTGRRSRVRQTGQNKQKVTKACSVSMETLSMFISLFSFEEIR